MLNNSENHKKELRNSDLKNWKPLSVSEIKHVFSHLSVTWAIAGGWALDLYLGKKTRIHDDIDIVILRQDQPTVFHYLSKHWMLYKAENGEVDLWKEGEYLPSINDIWIRKSANDPWAFQLMFVDTLDSLWIYKRDRSIRRELEDVFLMTSDGIKYLKPEIQLLYKGGSSHIRAKDQHDFLTLLPSLTPQAKEWLRTALIKQIPSGHQWIDALKAEERDESQYGTADDKKNNS
ncbi:hypothetical protein JOD43_001355 [Pullulanibacillus pueri]|uniref:Aminoglycoside-2''-adenylyltransferase n=1 Tax=Pullulanibacillus pueri TaxID=1437324 RepID=A0A8J2ZU44_9BACL|nr:hypothetical protein [Pullulanibacillus pueri]MBM7681188.1 hypothetical protein [Pullulanibacillus pueri]GGH77393.1 hypothetical protein GCM10007096_09230 [Pullulanibacillus pueri]